MEFLKEYLGEELYGKVAEKLNGNDKVKLANLAGGEYVSKAKYEAQEAKAAEYEKQLAERDGQLAELKKAADGSGELQKKIGELQTANEQSAKEWQEKLLRQTLESGIEMELLKSKARNVKAVKALLDTEAIKAEGDKLTGLSEQLEKIKAENGYLFGDEQGGDPPASGSGIKIGAGDPFVKGFDGK